MRRIATIAVAGSLLATAALPTAMAGATPRAAVRERVVLGHLNAPKHLLLTARGLYVVESGAGGKPGAKNCVAGPSLVSGTTTYCVGRTGAISLITAKGAVTLKGLPSVMEQDNKEVAGPSGIAFNRDGLAALSFQDVLVNAHGGNALPRPLGLTFGRLLLSGRGGGRIVDIARFEARHTQPKSTLGNSPGEKPYDSDPYDVAAYRTGFVVTDAAANSLLYVSRQGRISVLARFPYRTETVAAGVLGPNPVTIQAQAVPTSVAVGPDGALYVGLLRGVPSEPGTAQIYRVVPGHRATVWARGLTAVTAIAFDRRGRLLATELSQGGLLAPPTVPGALVRVSADGTRVTTLPVPGLVQPTGVAVGPKGQVWISNYGTSVATDTHPGQILAVTGLG